MKLKYFREGKINNGYGDDYGIVLDERVFSISKEGDEITFLEECDGCFNKKVTKDQAIELLQEAIEWIKAG